MRSLRCAACALLAGLACAGSAIASSSQPVLHFNPRLAPLGDVDAATSGPFVFLAGGTADGSGKLIDDRTGHGYAIPGVPDCQDPNPVVLGGGSLIKSCGIATLARYRLPSGPWHTFATNQQCQSDADPVNDGSCTPFAVGTRWLEFAVQCRRCRTSDMFQNLRTGAVSTRGNSGRFITSLDAASPVRRVCPPLSVPTSGQYWPEGRGAVAAYGQNVYALTCGSHRRVLLAKNAGKVVGSSSLVIWTTSYGTGISGVFLPTLQPFTESLPAAFGEIASISLTTTRIYVSNMSPTLNTWVGTAPRQPGR